MKSFGVSGRALPGQRDYKSKLSVLALPVRERIEAIVDQLAREATGSASRVARVLLMVEPPSAVKGEITDKGSLNQRAVLKHRHALVEGLHDDTLPFIIKPTV